MEQAHNSGITDPADDLPVGSLETPAKLTAAELMANWKKRVSKPLFVRVNDYKRFEGVNYIIRRDETGAATSIVGKAYRKIPTDKDVKIHLKMGRMVAQWGSKYFLYSRVTPEFARPVLERIWEFDERRGVPRPAMSDYDKEQFDI